MALKKIVGLVFAWKSGLKVPFLPLGSSCPLQTILLIDLVGCDSPLQIIMAIWRSFFPILKRAKRPLLSAEGYHVRHRKCKKTTMNKVCQMAVTICRGLSHSTGRAALPSENLTRRFFHHSKSMGDQHYLAFVYIFNKAKRQSMAKYQTWLLTLNSNVTSIPIIWFLFGPF
jgi:hypothetical protein